MESNLNLPFTGFVSFCRFPVCTELSNLDADIAILGVPFDEGSPWYPGTRFGPRRIRELSLRYANYGEAKGQRGFFDPEEEQTYLEYETANRRIWDCGDVDILHTNVEKSLENVTSKVKAILERGAIPVVMGGDHSITFPVVRAFTEPINIIQFDAHIDFRPDVYGITVANGQGIRRIAELANIRDILQIGIRGLRANRGDWESAIRRGNKIITANQFHSMAIEEVIRRIPEGGKSYVTIDIDVLDAPIIPGCASREFDGLKYKQLLNVLSGLAKRTQVVGFDVSEVNPMLDEASNITSFLAAQLMLEFTGRIVLNPEYLKNKRRAIDGKPT